eukprot:Sspe_Gene.85995::Locus_56731_Transcript_1_1_Confidence_1.000_Length_1137::g.85995::m.85995
MGECNEAEYRRAAEALSRATHLIFCTGAGWSAESGLATYNNTSFFSGEKGMDYYEVCQPQWAHDSKARSKIFRPFWEKCVKAYRAASPHEGYQILDCLLDLVQRNHHAAHVTPSSPYFLYTSNVDGMFPREGYKVCEIHGNVERWQCARPDRCSSPKEPWDLPEDTTFCDECIHCGGPARPRVVMFEDSECIIESSMGEEYQKWEDGMEVTVEKLWREGRGSVVVMEVGCGTRVKSVRLEAEAVVSDVLERCGFEKDDSRQPPATLIRVNPEDFTNTAEDKIPPSAFVGIKGKAVESMVRIWKTLEPILEPVPSGQEC